MPSEEPFETTAGKGASQVASSSVLINPRRHYGLFRRFSTPLYAGVASQV